MNNFYENIKSKGWDNFMATIENEFKHIREDLSVSSTDEVLVSTDFSTLKGLSEKDYKNFLVIHKTKDDIKKEFIKVREELNINTFTV